MFLIFSSPLSQCNPATRRLIVTQFPSDGIGNRIPPVQGLGPGPLATYWTCLFDVSMIVLYSWRVVDLLLRHRPDVGTGNPGSAGDLVTQFSFWGHLWHPGSLWGHMLPYDCVVLLTRSSTGDRNLVRPSPGFLLGVYFTRFSFRGELWSLRFPLGLDEPML